MTEREAFEGWAEREWPGWDVYWSSGDIPSLRDAANFNRKPLKREWIGWQAAAARYGPVVEAARNYGNATKAFHDSSRAKDSHAQFLAAQLIEQYENDMAQALAALDGGHE